MYNYKLETDAKAMAEHNSRQRANARDRLKAVAAKRKAKNAK